MAIKLFQSQTSMFCEKVRIVFAMKKVPYDIVDVRKDDRKSLIEYTGQRKVPSMDYNGKCVIDSTIISALLGPGRLVGRSFNPCQPRHPPRGYPGSAQESRRRMGRSFQDLGPDLHGQKVHFRPHEPRRCCDFLPAPLSLHGGELRGPG